MDAEEGGRLVYGFGLLSQHEMEKGQEFYQNNLVNFCTGHPVVLQNLKDNHEYICFLSNITIFYYLTYKRQVSVIISYHIISHNLFSFRKSVQDYIIHMDVEIVVFVGIKG